MQVRGIFSAQAKSARPREGMKAKGLERRHGLISFLTWAFVLSELFGRDALASFSARASEAEEPSGRDGQVQATGQTKDISDRAPTATSDTSDDGDAGTKQSPGSNPESPATTAGNVGSDPLSQGADNGGSNRIEAMQVTSDGGGAQLSPSSVADDVAPGNVLASEEIAATAVPHSDVPALVQLSISPAGLLSTVANIVDAVPFAGSAASVALETVSSTAETVLGGVSGLLGLGGADGAFASGGLIEIDMANAPLAFDAVQTAQGFTDYGIALELDFSGGVATSLSSTMAAPLADALNLGSGLLPMPDQLSPPDEAAQRASGDVLA